MGRLDLLCKLGALSDVSRLASRLLLCFRFPPWLDVSQDRARVLYVSFRPEPHSDTAYFAQGRSLNTSLRDVVLQGDKVYAQLLSGLAR